MQTKRVGIIGSGNWGTTAARVVAENVKTLPDFDDTVKMWVFDEKVNGESLVKIINTAHENVKYLPGYPLPENIVALANVVDVCTTCNYLVFVIPHQFLEETLEDMKGHILPGTVGLSLIKGITFLADGEIELVTDTIERVLGVTCGSLMGANIANDIAAREYCESTVAFPDEEKGNDWLRAFDCDYFHVERIQDIVLQQVCGVLKNIVATAGGLVDGIGLGQSTKAAVLRRGFVECYRFAEWYWPNRGVKMETMMESCGFGDIVASSYGGRNRKCAEYFVKTGKTFAQCEADLLNGQKLQGVLAASEIYRVLKKKNAIKRFPLISTIHLVDCMKCPPNTIFHPDGDHLNIEVE